MTSRRSQVLQDVARVVIWASLGAAVFAVNQFNETVSAYAVLAAIYVVVGLSLNVLLGYTGQLSLGHQGFFGVGALFAAYVSTKNGMPFGVALAVAAASGAIVALVLGVVSLRISGLYLALVTLVFGLTLTNSLFAVPSLTNGGAGQPANRPGSLLTNSHYYYVCLGVAAVVVYLDVCLLRSKAGRALIALKEDERAAAAFGINVTGYKLLGFMISGTIAGLAGGLFAFANNQFNGNDYTFALGLTFLLMTVVGGAGSREGVILGSVFFAILTGYLPEATWFQNFVSGHVHGPIGEHLAQFGPITLGSVLLLGTLVFNPGGIAQQIAPALRWLKGPGREGRKPQPIATVLAEALRVRP
jgi:branched-chain amino acid transport system permease protein